MMRRFLLRWIPSTLLGVLLGGLSVYLYLDIDALDSSSGGINSRGNPVADTSLRNAASSDEQIAISVMLPNHANNAQIEDHSGHKQGNGTPPQDANNNLRQFHEDTGHPASKNPSSALTAEDSRVVDTLKIQAYNPGTTLPEIMSSPEAMSLSPAARGKLLSELTTMLNRGEINPNNFLPNYKESP